MKDKTLITGDILKLLISVLLGLIAYQVNDFKDDLKSTEAEVKILTEKVHTNTIKINYIERALSE
jgi:hypothetical protein